MRRFRRVTGTPDEFFPKREARLMRCVLPALLAAGTLPSACGRSHLSGEDRLPKNALPADTTTLTPACGDGVSDADEACDSSDVGGATC